MDIVEKFFVHFQSIGKASIQTLKLFKLLPKNHITGMILLPLILPKICANGDHHLLQLFLDNNMYPHYEGYFSPIKYICAKGYLSAAIVCIQSGKIRVPSNAYLSQSHTKFIKQLKFHFAWKALRLIYIGYKDKSSVFCGLPMDIINYIIELYLKKFSLDEFRNNENRSEIKPIT